MTKERLLKLIKKKETQRIEFTSVPSKEIGNSICAFANTNDGVILVGVSDNGEIIGCRSSKKTEHQIANIAHSCKPAIYPEIKKVKIKGKVIFAVTVKKTENIHSHKNISYKRVGTHDKPMSSEEVIEFAKNTDRIQLDSQKCKGAQVKDIDKNKVKWFLQKAKEERDFDVNPNVSITEAIERLGLVNNNHLINAAVLLFAKKPQ